MPRIAFDPNARYQLHGQDSAGIDHLAGTAPSLDSAYHLRFTLHLNLKGWYALDTLTRNKCSLARIRDMIW